MTVNKLSYPAKENATQQKINEIIDDYVDLPSNQNITGIKTFVGQKRIGFKQSGSSDKLGFTLYNNSNVEKGYLEFNPTNTVDGAPLMTLGNYASSAAAITHVGFRKYSSVSGASGAYNLLAPLISNAKTPFNLTTTYTNFYLPLGFTDGTTMVTTANTGVVNISSLLPDISGKQDSSTAVTRAASTAVGSSTTPVYVASDGKATALSYTIEKSVPSNAVFTDTTYSVFTGADGTTAGTAGLVKAPAATDNTKYLKGDGTWSTVDALPSQTGNSGKYLTTNGSAASWVSLSIPTAISDLTDDTATTPIDKADYATSAGTASSAITASTLGSTDVGTATQSIYLDDGTPKACTYSLNKTVPSDAVFTDTTYSDFTGADSITAGTSGLVPAPSAGDNDKILTGGATWSELKTINNTSILGSGNIDTNEIFVATYGITTYAEIANALSNYKFIFAEGGAIVDDLYYLYSGNFFNIDTELYEYHFIKSNSKIIRTLVINSNNVWSHSDFKPVNKSGDTMTGGLALDVNGNSVIQNVQEMDVTNTPSTTKYAGFQINDKNGVRIGKFEVTQVNDGRLFTNISTHKNGYYSSLTTGFFSDGTAYATAPQPPTTDIGSQIATTNFVHQVIKSGEVSLAANTATWVGFSSAFPNNNVNVAICRRAGATTTAAVNMPFIRGDVNATGFNMWNPNSSGVTIQYIAKWAGS